MRRNRIDNISLSSSVVAFRAPEVEFEYRTAVMDLQRENSFEMLDGTVGPYNLELSIIDNRLALIITTCDNLAPKRVSLPITPFKRLIKDYFMICDSYYKAIQNSNPSQIETIDMAKRSLHNDGAQTILDVLSEQIKVDFDTARRLFTLVCVLHVR